jgi:hypothetical protein
MYRLQLKAQFALALDRAAFGLRRPKGNGLDDNPLQKIRNNVKLIHEQSGRSARQNASSRPGASNATEKAQEKIFAASSPVTH